MKILLLGSPSSPDHGRPPPGSLPRVQGPLCCEPQHLWAPTSSAVVSLGCWGSPSLTVLVGYSAHQPAQIPAARSSSCPDPRADGSPLSNSMRFLQGLVLLHTTPSPGADALTWAACAADWQWARRRPEGQRATLHGDAEGGLGLSRLGLPCSGMGPLRADLSVRAPAAPGTPIGMSGAGPPPPRAPPFCSGPPAGLRVGRGGERSCGRSFVAGMT